MALDGQVQQDAYAAYQDATAPPARQNRRAELVFPDPYQQLVADGRVFQINNAAIETADAIGTTSFATNGTNPAIYVGVPSGTTIVPLEVMLRQGGTIANDAFTVVIAFENAALYSSGGTAKTPLNLRTDDPNTSNAVCYTGATITAPTDDRSLHQGIYTQMVADPVHSDQDVFWTVRTSFAPELVGPASFLIYAYVATTAPSFFWRVVWWEVPTISAK